MNEPKQAYEHLIAERDSLLKFKQFVHRYLDELGVPEYIDGPHSEQGCRIGDRLDWVKDRMEM